MIFDRPYSSKLKGKSVCRSYYASISFSSKDPECLNGQGNALLSKPTLLNTKQEYVGAFAREITSTAKHGCRPIVRVVHWPNLVGQYLAGTVF